MDQILSGNRNDDDEDYYKLLNCSESASESQIVTEFRLLALKFHPDKNPDDVKALQEFTKLKEARDILLDPEMKASYDKWRRSQINISFKKWQNIGSQCHTTMHWARPKSQTMLENKKDSHSEPFEDSDYHARMDEFHCGLASRCSSWESDRNRVYGRFRRYEI